MSGRPPLRRVLDQVGGQIAIPDLAGATGWCFAAVADGELVGMLYACTPVDAIRACPADQHAALVRALIEIVAVAEHAQGRGLGTALVRHAEAQVRELGAQLITAKITATDMPVLRWWRHRGYTLARDDEACFLDQHGHIGLDAGHDGQWRRAAHAPDRTLMRRHTGLWLTPPCSPSNRLVPKSRSTLTGGVRCLVRYVEVAGSRPRQDWPRPR